jgi:hypothetical protein
MVKHVKFVEPPVSDQVEAIRFYADDLGPGVDQRAE